MRKGKPPVRQIIPDPRYNSKEIQKFINQLMIDGKKQVALSIFYGAIDYIQEKTKEEPLAIFNQALENVRPEVEIKRRRIHGSMQNYPARIRPEKKIFMGNKWIIEAARGRNEKSMVIKLGNELIAASKKEGNAMKKRTITQKNAEANKAFAHLSNIR